jgi:hypothetical protein
VDNGLEVVVAQSYSKNLGLYGERVGALNFVLADSEVSWRGGAGVVGAGLQRTDGCRLGPASVGCGD